MELDEGVAAADSCTIEKSGELAGDEILEPYVGMEFDSEDAARKCYMGYARRVGFVVRIMQRRRSRTDGTTLARRLGCNKQGFSPNSKGINGPEKKPRPSAREGCKATILVKMEKSGKWVVTRFVKEHNHPLVVTANGYSTVVRFYFPTSIYEFECLQFFIYILVKISRLFSFLISCFLPLICIM